MQEKIATCREFVEFLHKFTLLIEAQMKDIRTHMQATVSQIMESVSQLNLTASRKMKDATKTVGEDKEVIQILRSTGLYSKHMEAISTLDADIQSTLQKAVGALSEDDVMGQRLDHAVTAINAMGVAVEEFLKGYPGTAARPQFLKLRDRVLSEVYKSYTTEEERHMFKQFFGAPVVLKKNIS